MKGLWIVLLGGSVFGQNAVDRFLKPSDSLEVQKRNTVVISQAAMAAVSFIGLNQLWYSDYERSDFHWLDDGAEWNQMDKAGHGFSAYQLTRTTYDAYRWSGMSEDNSLIWSGISGMLYLSTIEVFDGYSEKWGASATDLVANASGVALFTLQQHFWKEQRIQFKYSYHPTPYADARPETLGKTFAERMLKDYNGQTYWLSFNLNSFLKSEQIPSWLNVAVGYGAEGMTTGNAGPPANSVFFPEKQRIRQYYLSLDVDLTKIKTESHLLRTVFSVVNSIKIPCPTLEITGRGKVLFHPIYF